MSNKEYKYHVNLGAAVAYEVLYDFDSNYLTDEQGNVLLPFAVFGGSPTEQWGMGQQATAVSERNPLPSGIKVKWFSVTENQFWEGEYRFNQQFLENLTHYTIDALLTRSQEKFTEYMGIIVYAVPGGLVTVWIRGGHGSEQFLLAQFQAKKVEEPNWDYFSQRVLKRQKTISREDYIKEVLSRPTMQQTAKELAEGKKPSSEYWQQLMKTYPWQLTLSEGFTLKGYSTWYQNGEKYYTYQQDNQLAKNRPVPRDFTFYFEGNGHTLQRFDFIPDAEEIKQAFAEIALTSPLEAPIDLHLEISKDIKQLDAFLIKGDTKIELKNIKVRRVRLYIH